MRNARIALIALAAALVGCGASSTPSGGDPNGNFTIALALNGGAKTLGAVAYSIFSTSPPDLATFRPSAAGGCSQSGSAGNYTVSANCLPHDGSPVYVNGYGANAQNDVTAQINGANTAFDYNISLGNGSGYNLAVGGVTTDGTSFCYGYTTTPFAISSGMKTTVNLTMTCIVPNTSSGFLNVNTTTVSSGQPFVSGFMTGPMAAEAISGTAGQVQFMVQAMDGQGDYINFDFSNVSSGGASWVSGTHDCDETSPTGVGGAATCTVTFQCGTVASTNDVSVTVWNTAAAASAGPPSALAIAQTTLDFGNVTCTP